MSETDSSETPPAKREDETSPFPLERGKSEPPPRPDGEITGERTGPFLLERERSAPDHPVVSAPPPPIVRLNASARSARRRVAITLFVHTLVLASLTVLSIVRWSKGIATPVELALAVLWGGVALVHLRAGFRFARLGRHEARDPRLLASALTDLRTVIFMKAVFLFGALAMLCVSLSILISLVASF